jgi:hypothetical protein
MKHDTTQIKSLWIVAIVLMIFSVITTSAVAATTQNISLHPGWNAVYLEVQPDVKTPSEVFKGLPVESVWTWFERSSVEFIRDPSEGLWAQSGWSVYTTAPDKAAAINLFAIFANRAYLIKISGKQNVTWSVTGTPTAGNTTWTPNSFNLTGFHINPAKPPTFDSYFAASPSHKGQSIYRLNSLGTWELIPSTAAIKSGEAYWVYCKDSSTYQGPVSVQILGRELDYGTTLSMQSLAINNQTTTDRKITLKFLPAANWFTYQKFNATTGYYEYLKLDSWEFSLSSGRQINIWLAVRRELLTNGLYQGTLEITDDAGSRFMVPVKVEKL